MFQSCPIIKHLSPAVSLPVTQASFPFIRWCSATMQQTDKIHSFQEVGVIETMSYTVTKNNMLEKKALFLLLLYSAVLSLNNSSHLPNLIRKTDLG